MNNNNWTKLNKSSADGSLDTNEATALMQLLSHQTQYIDQLEKVNMRTQEELQAFRHKLMEVVFENQALYDDMQSKVVTETLEQSHNVLAEATTTEKGHVQIAPPPHFSQTRETLQTSLAEKQELRDLKALYSAKISGLEAQVLTTRKDLESALYENEKLKKKLEKKLSISGGYAVGKSDGMGHPTYEVNIPIIERLTRERDDLLKTLASLRTSIADAKITEGDLRKDFQKSLSTVEEIQLQKNQVMVEKEQLKVDLTKLQEKYQLEITEGHKRTLDAVTQQRLLCMKDLTYYETKVGELMACCKHYEDELEKMSKEKSSILIQLEESRSQLFQAEKDLAAMTAEVKHEVKSALKGYTSAEKELRDTRHKLEQDLVKVNQDRTRYQEEALQAHNRLRTSEKQVISLQEMNIELTEQLNKVKAKCQKINLENSSLKKKFAEEVNGLRTSSKEEICELSAALKKTELEYEERLTDLEAICAKQSNLIPRLKEECANLENALDKLAKKYRIEMGKRGQTIEQMATRLERLNLKNQELSKQCVQHGKTHRQMEERLFVLNERANLSATKIVELLDLHNKHSKDKDLLNREVEFLQSQVIEDRSLQNT
ncbi:serologically defined colon cancer antigen 8 homolog isoform X2 [Clavelina lepadiformis]|uniref:serologically defined colon cancer antigen 8 homolog isoform X2 n=1 Tax=Clavelina lepadiformis TaxID=159417 RepID=UPI00404213F4